MRKTVQFLILCLLVCSGFVKAEQKFTAVGEEINGTAISPNGKYVVGIEPKLQKYGVYSATAYGFSSYLWDSESGKTEWMTEFDNSDFSKSGHFTDVNDSKTIVGYFKDPDFQITVNDWEGPETLPVNVAAIWKDGVRTSLGIGDFKLSDFNNFADGSFATGVSADGKTVVGFISRGNYANTTPCVWKYNDTTGKWDFSRFKLPEEATRGGQVLSVSADGQIAVGMVALQNRTAAAYWKTVDDCTIIEGIKSFKDDDTKYNANYVNGCAYKISQNGKYIAFSFNEKKEGGISEVTPAIYYTEGTGRYNKLGTYKEATGVSLKSITDEGQVFGEFIYAYGNNTRPFWYYSGQLYDFGYFTYLFASDANIPFSLIYEDNIEVSILAVSADGKTIMGNNGSTTSINGTSNWVLSVDANFTIIPYNVTAVSTKETNVKEVTVTWTPTTFAPPPGYSLNSFNVYCDGELIGNLPAEETGESGEGGITPLAAVGKTLNFVHKDVTPGYRKYTVSTVYINSTGKLLESPKFNPVTICVAENFDLPLIDKFDTGTYATNYWTIENWEKNQLDIFWGCPPSLIGIMGSGALNVSVSYVGAPYSSSFISRQLDARELDHVYASYAMTYAYVNGYESPTGIDSLSVEVTIDGGATWTTVKDHIPGKPNEEPFVWRFDHIDLSEYVAHNIFQLRFRAHGQGAVMPWYVIDLFEVAASPENEAPEGLKGHEGNGQVKLLWKNSAGAYELNYIANPYGKYGLPMYGLGDEGKEFIAVNSFTSKELEPYRGKYITSVRAFVSHNTEIEDSKDTHVSVVIYQDNQLIREQEVEQVEYNNHNFRIFLDDPVLVDPSKELKVGLKIFDYDERQIPILYENTPDFLAGKSDLYSQDNGKTWKKLSEYYAGIQGHETEGYGTWMISANITDEQSVNKDVHMDDNLMAYNIYRNGEKLNDEMIYYWNPVYIDENPLTEADYEVVAYYFDCSMSEASSVYHIDPTGIRSTPNGKDLSVYPNPATDRLQIDGSFDKALLLTVNGQSVLETTQNVLNVSGLPSGVYFLRIQSGERIEIRKIMIR